MSDKKLAFVNKIFKIIIAYFKRHLGTIPRSRRRVNRLGIGAAALLGAVLFSACTSLPIDKNILGKSAAAPSVDKARPRWRPLAGGVEGGFMRIASPPLAVWALRVDLANPAVEIVTNKSGPLPGVLAAVKVSSFLQEYDCVAALNGGPFEPVSTREGEARSAVGVFIRGGVLLSPPVSRYGALVFYRRRAAVLSQAELAAVPAGVEAAVGGFDVILRDGEISARPEKKARHPRSAAGVSADGTTLFLVAIDGRRPGSIGATEAETARLLRALGAQNAVNLDGGGSTAMAVRVGGRAVLVNRPAHRLLWPAERAVAVCIGVRAPSLPAPAH